MRKEYQAYGGPMIAIDAGIPVLAADLHFGLKPGFHWVRADRQHTLTCWPGAYECVSCADLHAERALAQGGRLLLDLPAAQECFRDYWAGINSQRELAEWFGLSRLSVHRLVHRRTYWWI